MTTEVLFHIEVEDCLWDEWDEPAPPPEDIMNQLETKTIEHVSKLFSKPVTKIGRRATDGALVCSFKTDSIDRVRQTIDDNLLTEGNDQIIAGEFVIVRDFIYE